MTHQGQAGEEPIKPGIYEQLVTEELNRLLRGLDDDLVSREPLDAADSHEVLARHLAALVTRALRSVPGGSGKPLLEQVRMANRIVEAIADAASDDHLNDLVAESADVLHAIAARAATPAPIRFPNRPEIPLSASALLDCKACQYGAGLHLRPGSIPITVSAIAHRAGWKSLAILSLVAL